MKDIKYYLRLIALACCVFNVACSDDDENSEKPVFPGLQQVSCAVGDEKALTFEATGDWTMVSSALWCSFKVNNEQVYSCSGTAGKQSVTIHISDDATELLKNYKAELTLKMGGIEQVIYSVTRPITGYEIAAYNEDQSVVYTEENPFVVDFDGKQKMIVRVNTDWVAEVPTGLQLNIATGLAEEEIILIPSLEKAYKKDAGQYRLIFKNKKQEVIAELPVDYKGIPADRIMYGHDNAAGTEVTVSSDASAFTWGEKKYSYEVPLKIIAKDNKYVLLYIDVVKPDYMSGQYEYNCSVMPEEESWFYLMNQDEEGNITLAAANNSGKDRNGYLMAFPEEKYQEVKDDFATLVFDSDYGIKEKYTENIAIGLKQEADPSASKGFILKDGDYEALGIELISYAGMVGDDQALEKYGTTNVWMVSLPLGKNFDPLIVTPKGLSMTKYIVGIETGNTAWNENIFADQSGMSEFTISGIGADTNGEQDMVFTVITSAVSGDTETYAVLIIPKRYVD